jgi:hypothetical protein
MTSIFTTYHSDDHIENTEVRGAEERCVRHIGGEYLVVETAEKIQV